MDCILKKLGVFPGELILRPGPSLETLEFRVFYLEHYLDLVAAFTDLHLGFAD